MENRCLIIVSTPLQVLCAISAICHFKINKYDLIFLSANDRCERINGQGIGILLFMGIPYKKMILSRSGFFSFLMCGNRYSDIYVGDYFFEYQGLFAAMGADKNAKITFLDDGNSSYLITLRSARRFFLRDTTFVRRFIVYSLTRMLFLLKNTSYTNLYTLFNVKRVQGWKIVPNNLECFRCNITSERQEGVFIIGTAISIFPNEDADYIKYLSAIVDYCRMKYPQEPIFYCPHRTSRFSERYNEFAAKLNLNIFNTEYTIEFDFLNRGVNPRFVIGFASSALYFLKKLYPESMVSSIFFESKRKYRKDYLVIRERYSELINYVRVV
jgi:hypothetical protein